MPMPAATPSILTIGAAPVPELLPTAGLTVSHAAALLDGFRRLHHAAPRRPTVILVDLAATEPGFPEFAAPQLIAVLAHAMHAGTLHPAWLVGLATDRDPDLDDEAYLAGCHVVLHAPLRPTIITGLQRLAHLPAPLPATDAATRAYQRAAERVLHAVEAAQIRDWSADDARLLLHALTPYPLKQERGMGSRTSEVLRALGGLRLARRRLEAIAESWQTRFPLHATILTLFLDGLQRPQVVRHFVQRDLYDDSHIYVCIRMLPQRLAQELRIRQADEEEDDTAFLG